MFEVKIDAIDRLTLKELTELEVQGDGIGSSSNLEIATVVW